LRRAGHDVSEAEDGAGALEMQRARQFDLVLLDLGLPDIDGFQVLEALRQPSRNSSVQVIILTASTATEVSSRAQSLGAAQVLHKPVSIAQLRAAIQSVFSLQPQYEPRASAAFESELHELKRLARVEIVARGRSILSWCGPKNELVRDVHRLAGLAGQFDAHEVAALADRLEAELTAGTKDPQTLKFLDDALSDFETA
jgi:two-component system chemotaxis response regulator CheY